MSNVGNRWEYVKGFEVNDALSPETYIVIRIDGRGFRRFTDEHLFEKPVDARGLALMNAAAAAVMREWGDIIFAYGHSDEYSFALPPRATVFGRRASKLSSGIASLFAAEYVRLWSLFMGEAMPLQRAPAFDARAISYPRLRHVCDYFRWRAADAHVNALYNEVFWRLIKVRGLDPVAAHKCLVGTVAEAKHELLYEMGFNYAKAPAATRRGTALARNATPALTLAATSALEKDEIDNLRPYPLLPKSVTLSHADFAGEAALLDTFFGAHEI
jgi:tRNA(His) guanylyltransferase